MSTQVHDMEHNIVVVGNSSLFIQEPKKNILKVVDLGRALQRSMENNIK